MADAHALLKAISTSNVELALKMVGDPAMKKHINDTDQHGNSPLNYACAMAMPEELLFKMLELGADATKANSLGAVPLTHAVYSKYSEKVLSELVRHGANPNYQNASGGTALQTACVVRAPLAIIKHLVSLGADPQLANIHGNTPLIFAVRNHNDIEVMQFLVSFVKPEDINHKTHNDPRHPENPEKHPGFTALHFACAESLPAHGAILVKHGAKLDVKNDAGQVPLDLCHDDRTRIAVNSADHHVHQ